MSISQRLDTDRKLLLQLSGSNPAISYKEFRAKGLRSNHADVPALLYTLLDEKPLRFELLDAGENAVVETLSADTIAFNGDEETLQRRLQKTDDEARLAEEEQGVNILFLALGGLSWKEDPKAEKVWRSPLLLIPVRLSKTQTVGRTKWTLRFREEDIEPNYSLIEALRQYHRLELPKMPDFESLESSTDLRSAWNSWLDAIQNLISGKEDWALDRGLVLLSFFSFAKYLMYQDLDPDKWSEAIGAGEIPVITGLLQDGYKNDTPAIPDDFSFDTRLPAEQPVSVLDMDSSQAAVLLEAQQSQVLIVQGPPGTGKSQTITNLIASAVGSGKKVLFVAEKMAALDVVKRNLTKVGLGPAVLELHGSKARKTAFLEALREVIENPRRASLPGAFSTASLNAGRDKLRSWSTLISTPLQACGYKPYELFGLLLWSAEQFGAAAVPSVQRLCDSELQFRGHAARLRKSDLGNQVTIGPEAQQVARLQDYRQAVGRPEDHPFFGVRLTQPPLASTQESLRQNLDEAVGLLQSLQRLSGAARTPFPELSESLPGIAALLRNFAALLRVPDASMLPLFAGTNWTQRTTVLSGMLDDVEAAQQLLQEYDGVLLEAAWTADVLEARGVLATVSDNFFTRLFNGGLRRARRQIIGLFRDPAAAKGQPLLPIADALIAYRTRIQQLEFGATNTAAFGPFWQGVQSDVPLLRRFLEWATDLHADLNAGRVSPSLPEWMATADPGQAGKAEATLAAARDAFVKAFDGICTQLDVEPGLSAGWKDSSLETFAARLQTMSQHLQRLPEWIRYHAAVQEFRTTNREWIVQVAERWEGAATQLLPYFRFKIWEAMLEVAMQAHPQLHQNSREQLDAARSGFSQEDQVLKDYYKAELINQHAAAVAAFGNIGQAAVVRSNLHRKRNIPPIRKLLTEAFDAVAAVKPVFMMSPLSVAGYLQSKPGLFDLVVFDEASQVEPVDAYGALLRAKQAVIVGDTKQMPPTGFFKRMLSEDAGPEEEDTLVRDTDSIMELMLARNARSKSLRWHYRSRHESLINVSNRNFYTPPGLLVYPSAFADHEFLGLKLRQLDYVSAPYEGQGTNTGEAKALVRELRDFIYANPDRSVGIVAFNIRQRDAIQKEIQVRARQDSVLARYIGKEGIEPFFVKNLENVQGDERDVIFISVGYGKTETGVFGYNFGALNNAGGERRLNVLITRARMQCRVFCNFSSDIIDETKVKHLGVRVLKQFLYYAEHGKELYHETADGDVESLFEEQVLAAIRKLGYDAVPQVGSRGYRIDLAIRHPQQPGRYVLAVECDGATYHSAPSARDRDRLRQSVLEGLGWRFYRIWSANWFFNQVQETERLRKAIEDAIVFSDAAAVRDESPAPAPEALLVETTEPLSSGPAFRPYEEVATSAWRKAAAMADMPPAVLERYMLQLIAAEAPVHQERIFERIVDFQGTRLGSKIRRQLESQLDAIIDAGQAQRRGEFVWKPGQDPLTLEPRNHASLDDRDLERISAEELDAAFRTILKQSFSAGGEELLESAARALGFARVTAGMRESLRQHMEGMAERGLLRIDGGRIAAS
jgi:very-short-patch-repair endonuclease